MSSLQNEEILLTAPAGTYLGLDVTTLQVATGNFTTINTNTLAGTNATFTTINTDTLVTTTLGAINLSTDVLSPVTLGGGVSVDTLNIRTEPHYALPRTVSIFTPAGTSDFALLSQGGSITLQTPDGTIANGDSRGVSCVDFQVTRTASTQVADGTGNIIGCGQNNTHTAATTNSAIFGTLNTIALSDNAFISGNNSTITSGNNTCTIGLSNTINVGNNSIAIGNSHNILSSSASIAVGINNTINLGSSNIISMGFGNVTSAINNAITIGANVSNTHANSVIISGNGGSTRTSDTVKLTGAFVDIDPIVRTEYGINGFLQFGRVNTTVNDAWFNIMTISIPTSSTAHITFTGAATLVAGTSATIHFRTMVKRDSFITVTNYGINPPTGYVAGPIWAGAFSGVPNDGGIPALSIQLLNGLGFLIVQVKANPSTGANITKWIMRAEGEIISWLA
jgi:hypothetical protein